MWKKFMLVGALLSCVGLPAFAAVDASVPVAASKAIPVELKGKLQKDQISYLEDGRRTFMAPIQRNPVTTWTLLAGGASYVLDLDNRHDLWVLAEQAAGQTVLVNGTLDAGVVHVASLKADPEHARKTVKVEVKGRLQWFAPPDLVVPLEEPARRNPILDLGPTWQLYVNDKVYTLDFGGAADLATRAQNLAGRTVIAVGVLLDGDVIRVASLAPGDEYLKVTETTIDLKGKLQYVITIGNTDQVVMVADDLPEDMPENWVVNYGMVVEGQTYILDLTGDAALSRQADRLVGHTALSDGVLDGVRVKVNQLYTDMPWLELAGTR
jgi:hypothetical protein